MSILTNNEIREGGWKWLLPIFILFIIVTLSFGIGYLVGREVSPAPIIIEKNSEF